MSRDQACLGYAMARTDDKPRGEAEFTQNIPRREGRRQSQNEGEANGYGNPSFGVNVDSACRLNYHQTVIMKKVGTICYVSIINQEQNVPT